MFTLLLLLLLLVFSRNLKINVEELMRQVGKTKHDEQNRSLKNKENEKDGLMVVLFDGHHSGDARLMVGLDDLKGLVQS